MHTRGGCGVESKMKKNIQIRETLGKSSEFPRFTEREKKQMRKAIMKHRIREVGEKGKNNMKSKRELAKSNKIDKSQFYTHT